MFMKAVMIGLPFLLFLGACGKTVTHKTPLERIVETNYSNSPVLLKKQNLKCHSKSFTEFEAFIGLHLFFETKNVLESKNMLPYIQGTNLRDGNVISRSVYGEEAELIISEKGVSVRTMVNPKDIKICPEQNDYEKETVESAALNATFYIHKTNQKIRSVFPDMKIAPISLSIGPSVIRSVVTRNWAGELVKDSSYMTDNAFYSPSASLITFLPHSKNLKDNGIKANFWEVPMVASHEYGHHIFQSVYQSLNLPLDCFGHPQKKTRLQKSLQERKVKQDDVLTAYNEGFADLIAHYTLDKRERDVHGVKCLEVSRDVASPVFYNGKPKIFDEEALRSFFSSFNDYTNGTCEDHSYQDVHVIGAIFAHNADKFLGHLTNEDNEKLAALVDWVKYLKAEKKKLILMAPRSFMKLTMSEFVKMSLTKFDKALDASNCKIVKDIYPQLELDECSTKKDL
jgi:hypothetical protein